MEENALGGSEFPVTGGVQAKASDTFNMCVGLGAPGAFRLRHPMT